MVGVVVGASASGFWAVHGGGGGYVWLAGMFPKED